jgi:hypothetical protein
MFDIYAMTQLDICVLLYQSDMHSGKRKTHSAQHAAEHGRDEALVIRNELIAKPPLPLWAVPASGDVAMIAKVARSVSLHRDEVQRSTPLPTAGRQARGAETARLCRSQ